MAIEEAVHTAVEDGLSPNTWRLWQAAGPAVVLGTGLEAAKEVALEAAGAEGIAVLRRHSGGGAVLIGPGVINYSAFYRFIDLPGAETIRGAMSAALRPVVSLLAAWGLRVRETGLSDLAVACAGETPALRTAAVAGETPALRTAAVAGETPALRTAAVPAAPAGTELRKIAGHAQARKKHSVLVHGTLLANPDLERIARLLRYPSAAPEYRAGRDHRAFLTSLREQGAPDDLASFTAGLARALDCVANTVENPSLEEQRRAAKLLAEKYGTKEWNLRR